MNDLMLRGPMTPDQIDLLKRTICRDGTTDDLALFVAVCNRVRLDPLSRQIYAVFRREKGRDQKTMTIQTGIDGLRLIADRTGLYEGNAAEWCGADGVWREAWLDPDNPPSAARATISRKGWREPVRAVATWRSYAAMEPEWLNGQRTGRMKLGAMWEKFGPEMLAKCAESLALRKAFPNETCGLRSEDEMDQADVEGTVVSPTPAASPAPAPKALTETPVQRVPKPAELREKARAKKAAEASATPPAGAAPTPPAPAPKAPATPPAAPAKPAAVPPEPPAIDFAAFVARLGGEKWEPLSVALFDADPDARDHELVEGVMTAGEQRFGADRLAKAIGAAGLEDAPRAEELVRFVWSWDVPAAKPATAGVAS